jgi:hypothetical protein
MGGQGGWTEQEQPAVRDGIPVEIGFSPLAAAGGFADLAGAVDPGHLTVLRKMSGKHGVVKPGPIHGTNFVYVVK